MRLVMHRELCDQHASFATVVRHAACGVCLGCARGESILIRRVTKARAAKSSRRRVIGERVPRDERSCLPLSKKRVGNGCFLNRMQCTHARSRVGTLTALLNVDTLSLARTASTRRFASLVLLRRSALSTSHSQASDQLLGLLVSRTRAHRELRMALAVGMHVCSTG